MQVSTYLILQIAIFRFNYRATHHMVENGFYNFLNWFDERAWYPLGRIVGGTVSVLPHLCDFSTGLDYRVD